MTDSDLAPEPEPGRRVALALGNPADLLAQRFARGEIDDNEYRNRLALLQEQR